MSSPLPPEMLDLIVDFLHDKPDALKACCLVSKSWIHRTREHLFAHVEFSSRSRIELWKRAFPDPSNSPVRHTRSLRIHAPSVVTSVDTGVGGWICTFSGVVRLHVDTRVFGGGRKISLVPLRGLSPSLKSLRLVYESSAPSSEIFGLVCSFPLLEDLALDSPDNGNEVDGWNIPSTSPKLTGRLDLRMSSGIRSAACRLLEFPSGLHFSKITMTYIDGDIESTMDLVSKCSDTLESLTIDSCFYLGGADSMPPLDLSRLTRLKEVVCVSGPSVQWITTTLQTAGSTNLQQIIIRSSTTTEASIAELVYREWEDLDRVLLQLWTSRSIRPKIGYQGRKGGCDLRELVLKLLPELTSRGVVDLVEWSLAWFWA